MNEYLDQVIGNIRKLLQHVLDHRFGFNPCTFRLRTSPFALGLIGIVSPTLLSRSPSLSFSPPLSISPRLFGFITASVTVPAPFLRGFVIGARRERSLRVIYMLLRRLFLLTLRFITHFRIHTQQIFFSFSGYGFVRVSDGSGSG